MTRKRFDYLSYAVVVAAIIVVGCNGHGAAPAPPTGPQPNAPQANYGTPPPNCPSCPFIVHTIRQDAQTDTTVDQCTSPGCAQAIVGANQQYATTWGWQGPPNPYPGYKYTCTVKSWTGTGITGVFVPATQTVPSPAPYAYICNLSAKAASTVVIGSYQYYVWQIVIKDKHGAFIGGGTFDTQNGIPVATVQGACSNNLNACPKLEILRGSTVISSPKPTPTAVVGEQQVLTMQQVPNTGKTGPYALSGQTWDWPTQAIKSYPTPSSAPSDAPTPTQLGFADQYAATLIYYMVDPTQPTDIRGSAVLTSSTETAYVSASAAFGLHAPPMTWTSVTNPVRVGPYQGNEYLSLGQPVAGMAGITWTIKAPATPTPLPGVSGSMNMTQTIDLTESVVPPNCYATTSMIGPELDSNLFYAKSPWVPINGTWSSDDSPAQFLPGQPPTTPSPCTSFTVSSDSFVDTLMFRSDKANSIWTPIMQFTWKWLGTANFSLPSGWSLGANAGPLSPVGVPSYAYPQWTGIWVNK